MEMLPHLKRWQKVQASWAIPPNNFSYNSYAFTE
jgi:hypothetical protein